MSTQGIRDFRPQIHFTPATGWINDPNGLVYVNGEYKCDLDENVYNGTEALNLSVHRLESHTYAAMDISNIYAGEADPALVRPNP